jgi:hypothetical protein
VQYVCHPLERGECSEPFECSVCARVAPACRRTCADGAPPNVCDIHDDKRQTESEGAL